MHRLLQHLLYELRLGTPHSQPILLSIAQLFICIASECVVKAVSWLSQPSDAHLLHCLGQAGQQHAAAMDVLKSHQHIEHPKRLTVWHTCKAMRLFQKLNDICQTQLRLGRPNWSSA